MIAETVAAMFPYYVVRTLGGTLYLAGGFVMAWNVYQTIRGRIRNEAPIGGYAPALQPAE